MRRTFVHVHRNAFNKVKCIPCTLFNLSKCCREKKNKLRDGEKAREERREKTILIHLFQNNISTILID